MDPVQVVLYHAFDLKILYFFAIVQGAAEFWLSSAIASDMMMMIFNTSALASLYLIHLYAWLHIRITLFYVITWTLHLIQINMLLTSRQNYCAVRSLLCSHQ